MDKKGKEIVFLLGLQIQLNSTKKSYDQVVEEQTIERFISLKGTGLWDRELNDRQCTVQHTRT